MSARIYTPEEIARLIAKYRWVLLVPVALGIAMVPILARFAPEKFRSSALILVVPQQVPDTFVQSTVSQSVADRLPSITAQILSRSRLEKIIVDMDLYKAERARDVMEDVVERMREDDVTTTPVAARDQEVNSFRIAYVSESAETAQKVTERLARLYIDQNLTDRANQADSTSQFLATQLETAKQRLIEQEKKLEVYRKNHAGQLPSQLQGNLQALQSANMQLQALNEATNRALERRLLIERQIADAQAIPVSFGPGPTSVEGDAAPISTARQLELARARLKALLLRYTPDHPEVTSAERTVAELVERLEGEAPLGAQSQASESTMTPSEAAQEKRIRDLRAELLVIEHQLTANREEDARLKKTIASYQGKVDVVPTRESELVELTRDYGTLQAAYNTLVMKREEAVIAGNLERRQIGEQFSLIDPASRPEKPYNETQRLAILASGPIVGLLIGGIIVAFREFRDSSFRCRDEVVKSLSLPVLASIPTMTSVREQRIALRRKWIANLAGSAAVLSAIGVLIAWRLYQ